MSDYDDYTIDEDGYQGNGDGYHHNGYDQLDGDYALFYKVAKGFTHKVKREDREDFLHDLFLAFARVKASYDAKGKELTTGGMVRVAQYKLADYWHKFFYQKNGIDCGRCSKAQREKCKEWFLYGDNDCPRAIKLESLDRLVEDGNGDSTPLCEMIADDNAIDLVARLDARLILERYPRRYVQLKYKQYAGYPLTNTEKLYLYRHDKKAQKTLV
jgi:hypothetical protein